MRVALCVRVCVPGHSFAYGDLCYRLRAKETLFDLIQEQAGSTILCVCVLVGVCAYERDCVWPEVFSSVL